MTKELEQQIVHIVENEYHLDPGEETIPCFVNYNEVDSIIENARKFMNEDNQRDALMGMISCWECDYADYAFPELRDTVYNNLPEQLQEDCSPDEIEAFLRENFCFGYNIEDFNTEVNAFIMLDVGNGNVDYTTDNILNYCGNGEIDPYSSILWLAKQQGKESMFREEVTRYAKNDILDRNDCLKELRQLAKDNLPVARAEKPYNVLQAGTQDWVLNQLTDDLSYPQITNWYHYFKEEVPEFPCKDTFVRSCLEELENSSNCMSTLTFLVKMDLFDIFSITEGEKANASIVIPKDIVCGLYSPWNGGGSCLDIQLDKEVILPQSVIRGIYVDGGKQVGYDPGEVYGLCGSAFKTGTTIINDEKEKLA